VVIEDVFSKLADEAKVGRQHRKTFNEFFNDRVKTVPMG